MCLSPLEGQMYFMLYITPNVPARIKHTFLVFSRTYTYHTFVCTYTKSKEKKEQEDFTISYKHLHMLSVSFEIQNCH